jgi:hypothetical protein
MKFLINKAIALLLTLKAATSFTVSPIYDASSVRRSTQLLASTRKPFITGNWKLNPQTRDEAVQLAKDISNAVGPQTGDIDVALFVPYVFIESAMKAVEGKVQIGAEVSLLFYLYLALLLSFQYLVYFILQVCFRIVFIRAFAQRYKEHLQELYQPQC